MLIIKRLKWDLKAIATSKMELFVNIFESFHSLTIVTRISILDVVDVSDPTIITDILASQSWILIGLKPIPLYIEIGQSILMAKKMADCYEMRIYLLK